MHKTRGLISLFLSGVFLLAACSSAPTETNTNNASPSNSTEVSAAPTATQRTISIPIYEYVEPTVASAVATAGVASTTPPQALSSEAVERGQGRYVALDCGSCHGENGEGTDQGVPLVDFAMTQADFISFMRSGGELGVTHQYATNRLSESGGQNLYQYLVSLGS